MVHTRTRLCAGVGTAAGDPGRRQVVSLSGTGSAAAGDPDSVGGAWTRTGTGTGTWTLTWTGSWGAAGSGVSGRLLGLGGVLVA